MQLQFQGLSTSQSFQDLASACPNIPAKPLALWLLDSESLSFMLSH